LYKSTTDTNKKLRIKREIRIIIKKLYGTNVSLSNANRNISNATTFLRGINTNINSNLSKARKYLNAERRSKGKGFPPRRPVAPGPKKNNYSVKPGPGYGPAPVYGPGPVYGPPSRNNRVMPSTQPPVSITISNIGKVSNAGKVTNSGRVSNSGTTSNAGRLAVSAPTTNGNRQLAATSEQLIRSAGGADAVEQGIKALKAANGNVTRAKAMTRLPNNTFTNIYAMGGPVAAKRLVEQRRRLRRTVGGRASTKKKRVSQKPRKKYIKLTPYQFRRLTDHIKKNNLRKVLIKEITH
jgi:hypothetical protein